EIRLAAALKDDPGELEYEALQHRTSGALIYPTRALASWRAVRLAREGHYTGIFGAFFCEFSAFAHELLRTCGMDPLLVDSRERRLMVQNCLEETLREAGETAGIQIRETGIAGLAFQLLDAITALKQAGIPPETFEERIGNDMPVDRLVLEVYRRYQQKLVEAGACDVPGLYWLAEEQVRTRGEDALGEIRYLYLDGFEDFTPSQIRFLKAMVPYLERTVIRLHYDVRAERGGLFLLQQRCLESLRLLEAESVSVRVTEEKPNPPKTWGQWLASWFGSRVPPEEAEYDQRKASLKRNIRLLPSVDVYDEADRIARDVRLRVIEQGEDPGSVAVVVPDIQGCGWIFQRAFKRQEVPVSSRYAPMLSESLAGSLVCLLARVLEAFDAAVALELSEHPLIARADQCPEAKARERFPEMLRRMLPRFALEYPETYLESLLEKGCLEEPRERWAEVISCFVGWCKWLRNLLAEIPETGTVRRYVEKLEEVLSRMGINSSLLGQLVGGDSGSAEAELSAWDLLEEVLAELFDVSDPGRTIRREAFAGLVFRAVRETPWPQPSGAWGILLGGTDLLRKPGVKRLYVAGMNEGIFPAVSGGDAVYSAESLARLSNRLGVTLDGPREKGLRQSLMLIGALERDREDVALSWRLQGPDGGEMFPGSFLEEIRYLLGEKEDGNAVFPVPGELPEELKGRPGVFHDALTVAAALAGDPISSEKAWQQAETLADPAQLRCLQAIRHGLDVERRRHDRNQPFDRYDGVLAGSDTRAWLARKYGPERRFSVSRLEQYLKCPYTFFVSDVLGVDELDQPAGTLEMSPMVRGSLIHDVLQQVFKQPEQLEQFTQKECLLELYRARAAGYRTRLNNLTPAALDRELCYLADKTARFLQDHASKYGKDPGEQLGAGLEVAFGHESRGPSAEQLKSSPGEELSVFRSVGDPLAVEKDGVFLRFAGRIDRIDILNRQQKICRLVDYKAGQIPASKAVKQGVDVQLTLYALAVRELFGWHCEKAVYLSVTDRKHRCRKIPDTFKEYKKKDHPTHGMSPEELWNLAFERAQDAAARAVTGIRTGVFVPVTWDGLAAGCVPSGRYQQFRVQSKARIMGLDVSAEEDETAEDESEQV
ncbi:MAG TPA: PD-(D/E)XK nuclease family protein, partial [Candidatus Hydrogenedentes bacterium]|nr:PD-(D/E)XK nuclease family protein [Candidatus Hydrogenedentota bacterium]